MRFTKPFPSFAPNTHQLYILGHCINIVFTLQKNHINQSTFTFWINKKRKKSSYPLSNCPFWYFLSTRGELDLQLGSQSSTGNMWQGYQKKLYLGQWQYITKYYPVNASRTSAELMKISCYSASCSKAPKKCISCLFL